MPVTAPAPQAGVSANSTTRAGFPGDSVKVSGRVGRLVEDFGYFHERLTLVVCQFRHLCEVFDAVACKGEELRGLHAGPARFRGCQERGCLHHPRRGPQAQKRQSGPKTAGQSRMHRPADRNGLPARGKRSDAPELPRTPPLEISSIYARPRPRWGRGGRPRRRSLPPSRTAFVPRQ